ncbi:heterogeneous nuclear ribonucleoprotein Q-like [Fagus crenata]
MGRRCDTNVLFEGGPSRTGPTNAASSDAGQKISKPNQPRPNQKLVWRPRSISSAQTSREPSPSPRNDPTPSIETVKDPETSQKALLSATLRRLGSDTENEVQIAGDATKWLLRLRDGRSLVLLAACFCKSGPMHGIEDLDHAIVPVYDGDMPEIYENWSEEDSVVDSVMDSAVETYAEVEQMTPHAGEHSPLMVEPIAISYPSGDENKKGGESSASTHTEVSDWALEKYEEFGAYLGASYEGYEAEVKTVFLDGLPPAWDEDRVKNILKKFGKIEKVELARNMPAAKRTDFGFITFDSHDAAVACVDGVNNAELGDGDRKVKIRARLSRPRQRGKTARQARGGYVIAHGSSHGSRGPWGSSSSRIDPHESRDRDGRSIQSRGAFDAGINRAYGPRDGNIVSHGVGSGRQFSSPERPYGRRSTVQAYGKTSSKRDYIQEDELYSRASDFDKHPIDRHSYRDAYPSRGSGYLGSPSRSGSRAAARRSSLAYDDYGYDRYMEQPSNYHDSHISDYSSIPTSKRPHSAIEEVHPRYAEPSVRQSRARFDYEGSSFDLPYGDNSYGSNSTRLGRGSRLGYDEGGRRSEGHSHGQYENKTSTMGYRREEISRRDAERVYSSYGRDYTTRDYVPSRSDLGEGSYPADYSTRRMNDDYPSGRGSGSYY